MITPNAVLICAGALSAVAATVTAALLRKAPIEPEVEHCVFCWEPASKTHASSGAPTCPKHSAEGVVNDQG